MTTKKKVVVYTLYFAGLFGRNRTVKTGSEQIAEVPAGQPLAEDEVRRKVEAKIAEIKPKPNVEFRWKVSMCEETHEFRDDGTRLCRSFMVFSAVEVLKGTRPASV